MSSKKFSRNSGPGRAQLYPSNALFAGLNPDVPVDQHGQRHTVISPSMPDPAQATPNSTPYVKTPQDDKVRPKKARRQRRPNRQSRNPDDVVDCNIPPHRNKGEVFWQEPSGKDSELSEVLPLPSAQHPKLRMPTCEDTQINPMREHLGPSSRSEEEKTPRSDHFFHRLSDWRIIRYPLQS